MPRGRGLPETMQQLRARAWTRAQVLLKVSFAWQHQPCPAFQDSPAASPVRNADSQANQASPPSLGLTTKVPPPVYSVLLTPELAPSNWGQERDFPKRHSPFFVYTIPEGISL